MGRTPTSLPLRPLALQAGLFAGLGLGVYALRRLMAQPVHPVVLEESPRLASDFPALAQALSKLGALGDEPALRALARKAERIAELDAANGPASQWQITRLSVEVVRDARAMCRAAPSAHSNDVFCAVLDCQDEAIPQLQEHLDNLLHNHLLARA
jgi:hypothetical protein